MSAYFIANTFIKDEALMQKYADELRDMVKREVVENTAEYHVQISTLGRDFHHLDYNQRLCPVLWS